MSTLTLTAPLFTLHLEQHDCTLIPQRSAERIFGEIRAAHGFDSDGTTRMLKHEGNTKLDNEMGRNAAALIASHTLPSGRAHGTCVNDATCAEHCVVEHSFLATGDVVQRSRRALLAFLEADPDAYATLLLRDLRALGRKAQREGQTLSLRLNTGSDVAFERWLPGEFWATLAEFGHAYDYTKRIDRVGHLVPGVYRTTYSATAHTSAASIGRILGRGDTVTVVLPKPYNSHDKTVPSSWGGFPMVSGDITDNRFLDPAGTLVGLSAKGKLLREFRKTGTWGPLVSRLDIYASLKEA